MVTNRVNQCFYVTEKPNTCPDAILSPPPPHLENLEKRKA